MGLFDRFRKKIKQADEDYGITAEDGSAEAEHALRDVNIPSVVLPAIIVIDAAKTGVDRYSSRARTQT